MPPSRIQHTRLTTNSSPFQPRRWASDDKKPPWDPASPRSSTGSHSGPRRKNCGSSCLDSTGASFIHADSAPGTDMRRLTSDSGCLDSAGKTTILYRLQLGEVVSTIPSEFSSFALGPRIKTDIRSDNSHRIQRRNGAIQEYLAPSVGSRWTIVDTVCRFRTRLREPEADEVPFSRSPYWRCYYANTTAVIYVVDSSDIARLGTARSELHALLSEDELSSAALLVYANKQDVPGAAMASDVSDQLGLHELKHRTWSIARCVATTGEGLEEGMDWYVDIPPPKQETASTDVLPRLSKQARRCPAAEIATSRLFRRCASTCIYLSFLPLLRGPAAPNASQAIHVTPTPPSQLISPRTSSSPSSCITRLHTHSASRFRFRFRFRIPIAGAHSCLPESTSVRAACMIRFNRIETCVSVRKRESAG